MTAGRWGAVRGEGRSAADLFAIVEPGLTLTDEQTAVVEAPAEPTLVVAGAGSGKTEALSLRLVYLLDHGRELFDRDIAPDEVLALTFTRKAAGEIAERATRRIEQVFGYDPHRPPPAVSTYNAYAAGLVGEHGLRAGVDPDSTLLTDAALWQIAARVAETWEGDLEFDGTVASAASAIVSLSSSLADNGATTDDLERCLVGIADAIESLPAGPRQRTAPKSREIVAVLRKKAALVPLIRRYREEKEAGSFIDFADQIAIGNRLAAVSGVGEAERASHLAVLLDEFQDTSPGQLSLFRSLYGPTHPVMAVGDPHQAIYGFRGAGEDALAAFVEAFGGDAVHRRTLLVSWRNGSEILAAANRISKPLQTAARVEVPPLEPRPDDAGVRADATPAISATMYPDADSEAKGVVAELVARRSALAAGREPERFVESAILCPMRKYFSPIVAALDDAGIDYQVSGLGGLVDRPVVADLLALLEVAHDPTRGDSLMRLLAGDRIALGIADLAALDDWAREREDGDGRDRNDAYLPEVLDSLPPSGWTSTAGRSLSVAARVRVEWLARVVERVRTHAHLPLVDLLPFAARTFGLDIEARVTAVERGEGSGDEDLAALVEASRGFASGATHATLGGFLAWIEAARSEERGLDRSEGEARPEAVQVMTVHGAKGREWDVVAVVGLRDGDFPKVGVGRDAEDPRYRDGAWLSDLGALPWPLRLDRDALPRWNVAAATDLKGVEESYEALREAAGRRSVDVDDRRLFYVALTRARTDVVLSGSWLGVGARAQAPSMYLRELVASGIVSDAGWAARPSASAEGDEARVREIVGVRVWPSEPSTAEGRGALAAEVAVAMVDPPVRLDDGVPHAREIEALLADEGATGVEVGASLSHVSATDLVSLARDRRSYAASIRRPVPVAPRRSATVGEAFHAWVERHYRRPSLLDPGDWGDDAEPDGGEVDFAALREAFLAGEWATRQPEAVEVFVEAPVGGTVLRCRIDAVFPPGAGLERTTIVDWKTGRAPTDEEEIRARDLQLAVYRAVWASWRGVPVDEVDAVFVYVEAGSTVRPASLASPDDIAALAADAISVAS